MDGRSTTIFSFAGGSVPAIFFLVSFVCVDARTLWVFSWFACVFLVDGAAKSVSYSMSAAWRSFGAYGGDAFIGFGYLQRGFLWRFDFHLLLVGGRCLWIPHWGIAARWPETAGEASGVSFR